MSTFAWLDSSDKERRRALDVVEAFRDRDTRDELGIGFIRDAIADTLFPGTTTLMTRARYFLFGPWIYQRMEANRTSSADAERTDRNRQTALINALLISGESEGVIGRDRREGLLRLPSTLYWQGTGVWGVRLYPDSQASYFRSLDSYYDALRSAPTELGDEDVGVGINPNWHPSMPSAPAGFPAGATLQLARVEAEYLEDRLRNRVGDSLLTWLVTNATEPTETVDFAWNHPLFDQFESRHLRELGHAQSFSEAMLGAALLYNLMLAERHPEGANRGWVDQYQARWGEWVGAMLDETRASRLREWDLEDFWALANSGPAQVRPQTRRFIDTWLDGARADPSGLERTARGLIKSREQALKGPLARLSNRRALDMWGGASGAQQLDFRWSTAQVIIDDIVRGLRGSVDAGA